MIVYTFKDGKKISVIFNELTVTTSLQHTTIHKPCLFFIKYNKYL
jgi:hypothetical protein